MQSVKFPHDCYTQDANNPANLWDLVREAYAGDWIIALIYRFKWEEIEEWTIAFYPLPEKGFAACEISWKTFQWILDSFTVFHEERITSSLWRERGLDTEEREKFGMGRKMESFGKLHYQVKKDSTHHFKLIQEAWIGKWLVAVLYRVGWGPEEEWHVSFFPTSENANGCFLSWENTQDLFHTFTAFREGMN